jgi:hypothetical protein
MNKALTLVLGLAALVAAAPLEAWTPQSIQSIGEQAARLAPPDLYRQLARNKASYRIGLQQPYQYEPQLRFQNEDGQGRLQAALVQSIDEAVRAIHDHKRFNEISYRMGTVVHLLAMANWPTAVSAIDPEEPRYAIDFGRYAQSTERRMALVFYGFRSQQALDRGAMLRVVAEAMARGRGFSPLVGREYRRVGFAPGAGAFDDKSTAFAIASLSLNHAVSDSAEVLRYIWLASGGIDSRRRLPLRGYGWTRLDAIPSAP